MKKQIIKKGFEAREALAKGAEELANLVGRTLGPYGENFFLEKGDKITNDGVTVAREVFLKDEVENRGVKAIREAAIKTNDEVGDGTTTATVLAWKIYESASRLLEKEGVIGKKRPSEVKKQINEECKEVIDKLKQTATLIETEEQLINSAVVSTEDKELGILIGKTQWKLGKDGYILAEETAEKISTIEMIKGVRIDNGLGTSQIINNQEKQTLEVEDSKILLTTHLIKTLSDWQKILKLYDTLIKAEGKNLVVVARAWTDETINWCLQNIQKGANIYPISAPYFDQQEKMKDLQAIVGGQFYDVENSTLNDFNFIGLGFSKKVIAKRHTAIISGSSNDPLVQERIDKRVKELEERANGSLSDFEKKGIMERIAQLKNGFALLKVGSKSEIERKRLFDKCEDAVNAVRAAFQEGTVKGAGLAYKEIAETLPDTYILKRPLMSIYEQIVSSAPSDFIIEDWVRDPLKVMRIALENAANIAGTLATAGGVIVQENPKELNEIFKKQDIPQENNV